MSEDLEKAFQNAQSFALIPILNMLKKSINYVNTTGVDAQEPGHINIHSESVNIHAKISNVSEDYSIMDSFNNAFDKNYSTFEISEDDPEEDKKIKEIAINIITHLLKSAFVVFGKLKEDPLVAEHQLDMNMETKLHLIGYSDFISVEFVKT